MSKRKKLWPDVSAWALHLKFSEWCFMLPDCFSKVFSKKIEEQDLCVSICLYNIKTCVLSIFISNVNTCNSYTMLRPSYYLIFKQCQDLCVICLYTMTRPVCYLFVYNVKTWPVCYLFFYTMSRLVRYLFLYNVKTCVLFVFRIAKTCVLIFYTMSRPACYPFFKESLDPVGYQFLHTKWYENDLD